ncbi:MAG: hypothetical protein AABX53_00615 [Nanoarchaeota archaeon]
MRDSFYGYSFEPLSRSYVSLAWSLAILVCFAVLSFVFYIGVFTGFAGLTIHTITAITGGPIEGQIVYDLSTGPLPLDAEVALLVDGYEKTLPLSSVIDPSLFGNYGSQIAFAPLLQVDVLLERHSSGREGIGAVAVGGGDAVEIPDGGKVVGGVINDIPMYGGSSGGSSEARTYFVRLGENVRDVIPLFYDASVERVIVVSSGRQLENSVVTLSQISTSLLLRTNYQELILGFQQSESIEEVVIDLRPFSFVLPLRVRSPALVQMQLSRGEDTFVALEESISVLPFRGGAPLRGSKGLSEDYEIDGGGDGEDSGLSDRCSDPACRPINECTIPGVDGSMRGVLTTMIRIQYCICADGSSYTFEEPCSLDSGTQSYSVSDSLALSSSSFRLNRNSRSQSNDALSLDSGEDSSWERTYSFEDKDIMVFGGIAYALAERERLEIPVSNERHSVGVVTIDRSREVPRVLVEVASAVQRLYVELGATESFDVTGDGLNDLSVTFVSLSSPTKALLRVIPFDAPSLSMNLVEGERAATLLRLPDEQTVGYVILNEKLPSLRVFFVQSESTVPFSCFNSVQDVDEEGIDCGSSCSVCRDERPYYEPLVAWIVVLGLFVLLSFFSRTRV